MRETTHDVTTDLASFTSHGRAKGVSVCEGGGGGGASDVRVDFRPKPPKTYYVLAGYRIECGWPLSIAVSVEGDRQMYMYFIAFSLSLEMRTSSALNAKQGDGPQRFVIGLVRLSLDVSE